MTEITIVGAGSMARGIATRGSDHKSAWDNAKR